MSKVYFKHLDLSLTHLLFFLVFFLLFAIPFLCVLRCKRPTKNTIFVGTAAEFPPFQYYDNGKIVGFDIDLINEIAQRMGKKIELQDLQFSVLIPHLQTGTLDVVVAGLTPTPERAQHILFSDTYLDGDPLVVVTPSQNKITDLQQLHGKTVIVNEGFSADLYMSTIKDIQIKRLATVADAFLALHAGNADAFVTAQNTLKPFLQQYGQGEFSYFQIPDTNEAAAIAITPKKPELVQKINAIIKQLKESGWLDELKRKWHL